MSENSHQTIESTSDSKPSGLPKRFLLIFGMVLLSMILYIDRSVISTVKDELRDDLGFSDFQIGMVFSIFAFAYALGQTPGGYLADRYGARKILTLVILIWSVFTSLTGVVRSFFAMLGVRFLFGLGEAGAYPAMARGIFSWLPKRERGLAHGLNFSGGRIGAAVSFPLAVWLQSIIPWQQMFWLLGGLGVVLAVVWYFWFRDDPNEHSGVSSAELKLIRDGQDAENKTSSSGLSMGELLGNRNMLLLMGQYICSNFTFFFMLSWSFSYLKGTYGLSAETAALYNGIALFCGAVGNWVAGFTIDAIYRKGNWTMSRRVPAIIGFALAAIGMAVSVHMGSAVAAVFCISLAVFGADMTLSPSWSTANDIGQENSGVVSGTMNMAGNLGGSCMMPLLFPILKGWAGTATPFFYLAAGLNMAAIVMWCLIRPDRPITASEN
jgi:ACS family glucarate transporter-like MFS transporter